MNKMFKRTLTVLLAGLMSLGMLSGCGNKKPSEDEKTTDKVTATEGADKGKAKVITIASHTAATNPNYVDPLNVESVRPTWKIGGQMAIDACKKELNVDIKYKKYAVNAQEDILKSVLANDPICDIAVIPWGIGTVIGQNVLEKLDKYEEEFKDPEYQWMMPGKIYGHNYTLNEDMDFTRGDVLIYNITYLEKIEALKENGKVPLPATLWKEGKWTWSVFQNYLSKASAFYANVKAPVRPEKTIVPYATDVLSAAIGAIKSTGESLLGEDGLGVDTPDTKRAIAYVDDLYSKKLITQAYNKERVACMKNGESVFMSLPQWNQPVVAEGLTQRGESMGLVPFPRPDDIPADDPRYMQICNSTGNIGIVKQASEEDTDLVMKVFKLYFSTLFKGKNSCDSIADYFKSEEAAKNKAVADGFDVLNDDYGKDMLDAYKAYNPNQKANEFYYLTVWQGQWDTLLRNSILGLNASGKYDAEIASQKQVFQDSIDSMSSIVNSDKVVDNIAPTLGLVGKDIALEKGTDASKIDWSKYIKAADNIDGNIDIKNVKIDASKVKFDTAGIYEKGVLAVVKDKEGNEKKAEYNVMVYDPANKTAPTLVAKEKYRNVKKDEDVSKINWGNDFVEKAESAEGFDLKNYITADVSTLDVTKAGKYDVTLTVTDYAGNKTEVKVSITVA